MRISDWSSDVCSSDLLDGVPFEAGIGEVVGDGPTLLALVLIVRAAADAQDLAAHRAYAVDDVRPVIDEDAARLEDRGLRRPMDILIGDLEIVDPRSERAHV